MRYSKNTTIEQQQQEKSQKQKLKILKHIWYRESKEKWSITKNVTIKTFQIIRFAKTECTQYVIDKKVF